MKEMKQIIKQINDFSKLAKTRELTTEEKVQREVLREEYRKIFKAAFEQKLQNIKFVEDEKDK